MSSWRRILILWGGWLLAYAAWANEGVFVLPAPVAAEFPAILVNRTESPVIFAYQGRRVIAIFDFPTLTEQGRMFNRLVALIERIGAPRERVLGNDELAGFIRSVGKTEATLAYGNDFLVSELVVFFNLAELGNVELNQEELALSRYLLDQRLMVRRNGFYQALISSAVILSLPQERTAKPGLPEVTALARRTILAHELSHAEYYTNPSYVNFCRHFWRAVMTEPERAAFRQFLGRGGYNPDNEEMMINESQAYLMHTPDTRAFSARLIGLGETEIEALRGKFRTGYPDMIYQ